MGDRKRKRCRKPKNPVPETVELENTTPTISGSGPSAIPTATATATDGGDVVFSVNNVELINSHNRRSRPRKKNKLPSSDPPTSSTKPFKVASPTRLLLDKPNGPASLMTVSGKDTASAVARVVPAMDSVVKVFCVHTKPKFSLPWQRKRQYSSSSSGFVIKGRRVVLTNAHSVEHYTQVKLKKRGSNTKPAHLGVAKYLDYLLNFQPSMRLKSDASWAIWNTGLPHPHRKGKSSKLLVKRRMPI